MRKAGTGRGTAEHEQGVVHLHLAVAGRLEAELAVLVGEAGAVDGRLHSLKVAVRVIGPTYMSVRTCTDRKRKS